jgi:hypothetical protein
VLDAASHAPTTSATDKRLPIVLYVGENPAAFWRVIQTPSQGTEGRSPVVRPLKLGIGLFRNPLEGLLLLPFRMLYSSIPSPPNPAPNRPHRCLSWELEAIDTQPRFADNMGFVDDPVAHAAVIGSGDMKMLSRASKPYV